MAAITWRNLLVYRTRAMLTVCGIFFGIVSIIGTFTVSGNLSAMIAEELNRAGAHTIVISANYGDKPMNPRSAEYARKYAPAVQNVFRVLTGAFAPVVYRGENTFANVTGVDAGFFETKRLEIHEGRSFRHTDVTLRIAIMGDNLARRVFRGANPVGRSVLVGKGLASNLFRVVGVLEPVGESKFVTSNGNPDDTFYVPHDAFVSAVSSKGTGSLVVQASSDINVDHARSQVLGLLSGPSQPSLRVSDPREEVERNRKLVDGMVWSGVALGILSLISGGIGIMNIMLVSVMQRKREIGLYKAIGFSDQTVLLQFISEALAICVIGSIFGVFVGIPAGSLLSSILLQGYSEINIPSVLVSVAFSLFIGVGFGFLPAKLASKLDPVDALKGQA
ncbi:MAG: ABC transporter permease [Bdellovibrionia bacterium]